MTTDIGSWVIKDPDRYVTRLCPLYIRISDRSYITLPSLSQPITSGSGSGLGSGSGSQQPDRDPRSTKRRRHSSESSRQYSGEFPSGGPSGSQMQMPFPHIQFGSSSRYQMPFQDDVGLDVGSYALSNTRSSYLDTEVPFGSSQFITDQDAGKRINSRRSPRGRDDVIAAYGTTGMSDPGPTTADIVSGTPSSVQAASAGMLSLHTTQSTPAPGSAQARPPDTTSLYNDARGPRGDVNDVSVLTDL